MFIRISLVLATLTFLPGAAFAQGTNLTCTENGQVTFNIIGGHFGSASPGTNVTIVANGILHVSFETVVDRVDDTRPGLLILDVTTLNRQGGVDAQSGKATLTLGFVPSVEGKNKISSGTAHIRLSKFPSAIPNNIRFHSDYDLTSCTGSV